MPRPGRLMMTRTQNFLSSAEVSKLKEKQRSLISKVVRIPDRNEFVALKTNGNLSLCNAEELNEVQDLSMLLPSDEQVGTRFTDIALCPEGHENCGIDHAERSTSFRRPHLSREPARISGMGVSS